MIITLLGVILISFFIVSIGLVIKRYRTISVQKYPHPLERFEQSLPKVITKVGLLSKFLFDVKIVYYSLITLFKKDNNLEPASNFSYDKASQFKVIAIVIVIIILIESTLIHILMEHFLLNRYSQIWIHLLPWLLHVFNVYVILLFVAQHRSMKALPHQIANNTVTIYNGIFGVIETPYENILKIEKVKELGLFDKADAMTFYAYNKIDSPHYEITLVEAATYEAPYGKRVKVNKIVTRVDNQVLFLKTIKDIVEANKTHTEEMDTGASSHQSGADLTIKAP